MGEKTIKSTETYTSWELGSAEAYVMRGKGLWTCSWFHQILSTAVPTRGTIKIVQVTKFLSLGNDNMGSYFQYLEFWKYLANTAWLHGRLQAKVYQVKLSSQSIQAGKVLGRPLHFINKGHCIPGKWFVRRHTIGFFGREAIYSKSSHPIVSVGSAHPSHPSQTWTSPGVPGTMPATSGRPECLWYAKLGEYRRWMTHGLLPAGAPKRVRVPWH